MFVQQLDMHQDSTISTGLSVLSEPGPAVLLLCRSSSESCEYKISLKPEHLPQVKLITAPSPPHTPLGKMDWGNISDDSLRHTTHSCPGSGLLWNWCHDLNDPQRSRTLALDSRLYPLIMNYRERKKSGLR